MCTLEKRGTVFVLTLTGDGEHWLNPPLLDAIKAALLRLRSETPAPSALITTAHGRFFSNGLDLAWARSSASGFADRFRFMGSKFEAVIADLVSLPMPTIAAVTGHASAAGFLLALGHDYILMREDRGFLYMSELDIGLLFPAWLMALVRYKIASPAARRDVVLRAEKLTAKAALARGIIHSAHGSAEETMAAAVRLGDELGARAWDGHVYGRNRMELYPEVVDALGVDGALKGSGGITSRF